jgi:hypothetical protein
MFKATSLFIICALLSACAHTDATLRNHEKQISDLQQQLIANNQKIDRFQQQVIESDQKIGKFEEELGIIVPPADANIIPVDELCTVPELYLDKIVTVRGGLFGHPSFREPVSSFTLAGRPQCLISCQFKKTELDPRYRRLLSMASLGQSILVTGQFASPNTISVLSLDLIK